MLPIFEGAANPAGGGRGRSRGDARFALIVLG